MLVPANLETTEKTSKYGEIYMHLIIQHIFWLLAVCQPSFMPWDYKNAFVGFETRP